VRRSDRQQQHDYGARCLMHLRATSVTCLSQVTRSINIFCAKEEEYSCSSYKHDHFFYTECSTGDKALLYLSFITYVIYIFFHKASHSACCTCS
jgi:hypothetical protein